MSKVIEKKKPRNSFMSWNKMPERIPIIVNSISTNRKDWDYQFKSKDIMFKANEKIIT